MFTSIFAFVMCSTFSLCGTFSLIGFSQKVLYEVKSFSTGIGSHEYLCSSCCQTWRIRNSWNHELSRIKPIHSALPAKLLARADPFSVCMSARDESPLPSVRKGKRKMGKVLNATASVDMLRAKLKRNESRTPLISEFNRALIACAQEKGQLKLAEDVMDMMRNAGVQADERTFNIFLRCIADSSAERGDAAFAQGLGVLQVLPTGSTHHVIIITTNIVISRLRLTPTEPESRPPTPALVLFARFSTRLHTHLPPHPSNGNRSAPSSIAPLLLRSLPSTGDRSQGGCPPARAPTAPPLRPGHG